VTARRAVVAAVVLWLVFAGVVWNVVFDRMVVLAGRRYVHDAWDAYHRSGRYLLIDDVMRPAVAHAAATASIVGGAIAVIGGVLIWGAVGYERRRRSRSQLTTRN
jgi:hypothetical protein